MTVGGKQVQVLVAVRPLMMQFHSGEDTKKPLEHREATQASTQPDLAVSSFFIDTTLCRETIKHEVGGR